MKAHLRSLALALACLLSLPVPVARAQFPLPASETVFAGALTTQPAGQSQAWAWIFWQTAALDLSASRSYSVWQKPGNAAAPGNFTRIGIAGLQSDPGAVNAILERSRLVLGEDPVRLNELVTSLFQNLMPTLTDVPEADRLAARVSAVLRGVAGDPARTQALAFAARYQPSLAMAIGQGFSAKIPSSGPVTFEIREYDAATQADAAVLGRVTVDHAVPLHLPPPTVVYQVPDQARAGFNHLNVRLVWDTPDDLRRLFPFTRGASVYRVKRAIAETAGHQWQQAPPDASTLATLASVPGSGVGRVNVSPVLPRKLYHANEVASAQPGDQFIVDDSLRMPGYPDPASRPENGDQYYYFLTSVDVLGRENTGAASPGLLATFCDRLTPDAPQGLKVTSDYTYLNGAGHQKLRLTWKQNDNTGEKKTRAYLVYRWETSDGPQLPEGNPALPASLDPAAHLLAGPLPHVPGQATLTYLDDGPGSPSTPADEHRTFWYTVRAVDDEDVSRPPGGVVCAASPFGGNVSPSSPPAFGTLRDRTGPDAPDGTVKILCPDPRIAAGSTPRQADATLDVTLRYVELTATRPPAESNIAAVDFERQTGTSTWTSLGRVTFSPGAATVVRYLTFPSGSLGTPLTVRARTVTATGDVSAFASLTFPEPPAQFIVRPAWTCSVAYQRVPLTSPLGLRRCAEHTPPPADSGIVPPGGNGIVIDFHPPAGTRQYKLYYRIDNNALTLIKEDSAKFSDQQLLSVVADLFPAVTSEVCLFLQVFDIDGNPSPMQPLGCFNVKGTTPLPRPMLSPVLSIGSQSGPAAGLRWFCPPPGVERFEVWIGADPAGTPASLAEGLNLDPATPTGTSVEQVSLNVSANFTYQIYRTEQIGPLFGDGSSFYQQAGLGSGQKYRIKVRAITDSGQAGPFSNVETWTWSAPPPFTGPDTPWPARALPAIGGLGPFSGTVAPYFFPAEGFVGISIGGFTGGSSAITGNGQAGRRIAATPGGPASHLFTADFAGSGGTRNPLPCVLYRTQVADLPAPPGKPLANYPTVPGDVVQVSPLLESIAYLNQASGDDIYDPFVHIVTAPFGSTDVSLFYLKDTTPVTSGARYVYLLVLLDPETHEISHVLPLPPIDIP